mmetsp:Transcript_30037/g.45974  ORF Transcript_30037/g.45974 Transcript_30037/m.45974 type:complete len:91 (-) Transcript_30037:196-468(-)
MGADTSYCVLMNMSATSRVSALFPPFLQRNHHFHQYCLSKEPDKVCSLQRLFGFLGLWGFVSRITYAISLYHPEDPKRVDNHFVYRNIYH